MEFNKKSILNDNDEEKKETWADWLRRKQKQKTSLLVEGLPVIISYNRIIDRVIAREIGFQGARGGGFFIDNIKNKKIKLNNDESTQSSPLKDIIGDNFLKSLDDFSPTDLANNVRKLVTLKLLKKIILESSYVQLTKTGTEKFWVVVSWSIFFPFLW